MIASQRFSTATPPRLVVFDMEGCLTDDPTVWEIMHRHLGTWQSHGEPYWNRYRAGEFEYDRFARMDVAVWRGAPLSMLHGAARSVQLVPGCEQLLEALAENGTTVAIISNGLRCLAERFRGEFGVEHIYANRAVVDGARLTGEIRLDVPFGSKGRVLVELAEELGMETSRVAAVGDGPADCAMFREAGTGIAFCPAEPSVSEAATWTVSRKDLRELMDPLLASSSPT